MAASSSDPACPTQPDSCECRLPEGRRHPFVKLATGELFYNYPQVLPGGKAVLVAVVNTPASLETTNVDVISLDDGRRTTLVRGGTSPRYLPSGHVVYARRAKLFAIPFDIDSAGSAGARGGDSE